MQFLTHKVVASLPAVLEPNSVYYVRVGLGFDLYVTNNLGLVVAYPLNHPTASGGVTTITPQQASDLQVNQTAQIGVYYISALRRYYGGTEDGDLILLSDPETFPALNAGWNAQLWDIGVWA